ncbi:MAG: hypothetical protein K6B52_03065 [Clostridiales bacterium]|nr:hypothetical protein [Clostridiales bacterium]
MEDFIKNQVAPTLKHLPKNLLKSYFISDSNAGTRSFRKNTGFIKGICHPSENFEKVKGAGLEWVRSDIPFPFEGDGQIRQSYIDFKARVKRFKDNGFKIMAVSPYPGDYIDYGIDPREEKNKGEIEKIAKFIVTDLQGYIDALQITNEMGIPRFTLPLSLKQGAEFIAANAKAMFPDKGEIVVGYNCAGPQTDLNLLLLPYMKYIDWVGIDIYMGCFFFGTMWMFDALIRYLWAMTKKPVIICEYGYISGGKPKTKKEKEEIVHSYGAKNEKDARENIVRFVGNLPERMREYVKKCAQEESNYAKYIFHSEFTNHFYRELPRTTKIPGYDHTPEGQAKFYANIIPRLSKYDFLCGMIVYCWQDSDKCYVCGQSDCPTETRWGLVDMNENEKPSYYAVKDAFAKVK